METFIWTELQALTKSQPHFIYIWTALICALYIFICLAEPQTEYVSAKQSYRMFQTDYLVLYARLKPKTINSNFSERNVISWIHITWLLQFYLKLHIISTWVRAIKVCSVAYNLHTLDFVSIKQVFHGAVFSIKFWEPA